MNKTADQLSPAELAHYKKIKINRAKQDELSINDKYIRAKQVAKNIATLLYENYNASKVLLFGSVIKPEFFNEFSDIDIAVIGIPDNRFFSAVAAVTEISFEFKIDLIDPNDCSSTLKEAIFKEGILL